MTELEILKKAYKKALKEKKESFLYSDREILVSYAKYLIDYLEENNLANIKEGNSSHVLSATDYHNFSEGEREMVDMGMDIAMYLQKKEKEGADKGWTVSNVNFFIPYIESDGTRLSSPGSMYSSLKDEKEARIFISAMTEFFLQDTNYMNIFNSIIDSVRARITKAEDDEKSNNSKTTEETS